MSNKSKTLNVPFFVQPTTYTCQSTCLKMYAKYLERKKGISSTGGNIEILAIYEEINSGEDRPSQAKNAYVNMIWWLEKYFHPTKFQLKETKSPEKAISNIVNFINNDYPVIVSTNHSRTSGHIILVVGYEEYDPLASNENFRFICHDPYGRFDPKLQSQLYGKRRYETGVCLITGSHQGPGKAVKYDRNGIRRIRSDKHSTGTYYLISGTL